MMGSKYMNLVKILVLIWFVSIARRFFANPVIKLHMKKKQIVKIKIKIKIKRRVNKKNKNNMK